MVDRSSVAVVGAGVAGLASSLELARLGLHVTTFEQLGPGGQVLNAGPLGHVPGFTAESLGPDLVGRLMDQATDRGALFELAEVTDVAANDSGFVVASSVGEQQFAGLVIALGTRHRRLDVPGEDVFEGLGVSHCAQCDGDLYVGQDVAIIGGGDAALESAAHLSSRARQVTLIHRGSAFTAAQELTDQGLGAPNVSVRWQTEVITIAGAGRVEWVEVRSDAGTEQMPVGGVFVTIGEEPQNAPVAGLLRLEPTGHISVDLKLATSVPGVFAAGMCRAGSADQVATAIGDGVAAARGLGLWLRQH